MATKPKPRTAAKGRAAAKPKTPAPATATDAATAATTATTAPANAPAPTPKPEKPDVFDQAVGFVLEEKIEGGYVNDPRDPGGETNYGISKRAYPKLNIASLTVDDAVAIYRRDYWDTSRCDELPPHIAVAVFDCAVNQGVGAAKRLLQRAARVTADGQIGPITLRAVHRANAEELLTDFLSWRLRRYAFTVNASTFLRGWSKRVLYLQSFIREELEVA